MNKKLKEEEREDIINEILEIHWYIINNRDDNNKITQLRELMNEKINKLYKK